MAKRKLDNVHAFLFLLALKRKLLGQAYRPDPRDPKYIKDLCYKHFYIPTANRHLGFVHRVVPMAGKDLLWKIEVSKSQVRSSLEFL